LPNDFSNRVEAVYIPEFKINHGGMAHLPGMSSMLNRIARRSDYAK
jgi:hypothetical protein